VEILFLHALSLIEDLPLICAAGQTSAKSFAPMREAIECNLPMLRNLAQSIISIRAHYVHLLVVDSRLC
jgi:hypothetical protein